MKAKGFAAIIGKLVAAISYDTSMAAILGSAPTSDSVDEGLASYIKALRAETGSLLAGENAFRALRSTRR